LIASIFLLSGCTGEPLLLAEKSVKEIAQELQMAEKRIYAIKLSLQNKMGGRGKLNIILSG
uniref:hypothetical protein n=1 Tax=Klebsiella pneumoniae TaxID=573 RepID=UPI000665D4D7